MHPAFTPIALPRKEWFIYLFPFAAREPTDLALSPPRKAPNSAAIPFASSPTAQTTPVPSAPRVRDILSSV